MLAHAMADVGCRIIAFAIDIHPVAKSLQTVFLYKWKDFCPNFLTWPVSPRLLQKVWGFFVMMIDVEGKAISEAQRENTLQQVSAGFFQVLASLYF